MANRLPVRCFWPAVLIARRRATSAAQRARDRSLLAERLRGNVGSYQSVSELTISTASADHYPTHAQLIQSHPHAPFKALENVIDGGRSALKRFQKNIVNC